MNTQKENLQPSTINHGVTIVGGDRGLSKETSHEKSDNTSQSVNGENIHWIVDPHGGLESGTQVGNDSGNNTDKGTCGCATEPSSGSDGDKSSNGTGTETDDGPFTFESEIHEQPSEGSGTSCQVGVEDGECGFD